MQCPTKLFFHGKDSIYSCSSLDDSFLEALAEGGFQVGELAKQYFPEGVTVETLDHERALLETNQLLMSGDVTIFEAAVRSETLFARVDILVRTDDELHVIEVKSKSHDSRNEDGIVGRRGQILAQWKPYLWDVAFQKEVLARAFPDFTIRTSLMVVDKAATCPSDGLNQKFQITRDSSGRMRVVLGKPLTERERNHRLLFQISVDELCELIYQESLGESVGPNTFQERIDWLAYQYRNDIRTETPIGSRCSNCEFVATADERTNGLLSGFHECWRLSQDASDQANNSPTVLSLWNFRGKDRLIETGQLSLSDLSEDDINPTPSTAPGLSTTERQWLQVKKAQARDTSIWIDHDGLRREMEHWTFPLHMIDFETSRVAIPFHRGHRPYALLAFQFSHHIISQDRNVKHVGEFLSVEPGKFPNYEFVRALKSDLENDDGSIFCYSHHETTCLAEIARQLNRDNRPPDDKVELLDFIQSISRGPEGTSENPNGHRSMVDLLELVKRYYYAPETNGSNSLKAVLPATLNASPFLKAKYSQPVYGASNGIPSKNFRDMVWIQFSDSKVIDPYQQLPNLFDDIPNEEFHRLNPSGKLDDGGAAMIAYARMQFEDMDPRERTALQSGLLRYCELDTLAMVMLYEAWADWLA